MTEHVSASGATALAEPEPASATVLPRRLGAIALMLIIVAFNAPIATMAGFAQLSVGFGNGVGAPVAFFVAGAILLLFAVGFVAMSRYIEHPGAFYRFIVAGLGRAPGLGAAFVACVAYILLTAGSYPYMGLVAVDLMNRLTGSQVLPWQGWTLVFLGIITVLGLLRIDLSMKVLGTLVCLEITVVAIYEIAAAIQGGPEGYSSSSFSPTTFATGHLGLGVLFAMLCMIGIEAGACFRDEAKDPERSVGRATYGAIIFMAIFYGLGVWFYIISQGASKVVKEAQTDPVGSFLTSVHDYLGAFFVTVVAAILVTSQMAAINAIQGAASRYLFSLGRDHVMPSPLARVHRRLQSPYVAVLTVSLTCLAILAVIMIGRFDVVRSYAALTGMGIYFILPLLILTSAGVVVFYRKNLHLPVSWWSAVIAPALACIGLIILFVLVSGNMTVLAGSQTVGYVAMALVVIVFFAGLLLALRFKRTRPDVYDTIGNQ